MNKKNFILSIAMGVAMVNGVFASTPNKDVEVFDINSVEYIEEDERIELGFDVADYLPEDFDPYKIYFDLNSIEFIESEFEVADLSKYLPENFNAYAYPTDVQSINYIDENDIVIINFDTKKYLPKGFNAYAK